MAINIYCDESRHLEHDRQPFMLIGATWCPGKKVAEASERIREIKRKHGMSDRFELKWSKVSPAKVALYRDVIDYFFDDDDLHFRVLVALKAGQRPESDPLTHDGWYYQMYFTMLKTLLRPDAKFQIYLDYKDTLGAAKVKALHDVLCTSILDFNHNIVERMQLVRSHEVQLIQVTDVLLGAVGFANIPNSSKAKLELVNRIRHRSKYSLAKTTLPREEKFNISVWRPKPTQEEGQ